MRPIDAAVYGRGSAYWRSRSADLRATVIATARAVDGTERAQVVFSVHLAPRDDMTANDIEAAVDVLEAYPGAPRRHEPYSSRGSTRSIRSSCLSVSPGGPARELESVQPVASINNSPLWNLVPATLGASMAPRNRGRRRKLAPAGGAAAYA